MNKGSDRRGLSRSDEETRLAELRRLKPAAARPPGVSRERHHRLARECYCDQVNVAFTLCVANNVSLLSDNEIVSTFVTFLSAAVEKHDCIVLIYCFMPNHVHLLLKGRRDSSDTWAAVTLFKQRTGFWLGRYRPRVNWQKDFYDHIIRLEEDLGAQVRYIAGNPVRKGLVKDWQQYPFTNSIGVDLNAVIRDTITL